MAEGTRDNLKHRAEIIMQRVKLKNNMAAGVAGQRKHV
jgi:hypothetical protein